MTKEKKNVMQLLSDGRMSFGCMGELNHKSEWIDSGEWGWSAGSGSERRVLTLEELIEAGKATPFDEEEEDIEFLICLDAYLKCILYRKKDKDTGEWSYSDEHLSEARFASEVLLLGLEYKRALQVIEFRKKDFEANVNELLELGRVPLRFKELSKDIPVHYRRTPRKSIDYRRRLLTRIEQHTQRIQIAKESKK